MKAASALIATAGTALVAGGAYVLWKRQGGGGAGAKAFPKLSNENLIFGRNCFFFFGTGYLFHAHGDKLRL